MTDPLIEQFETSSGPARIEITPAEITPATITPATITPATITPATITPATITPATTPLGLFVVTHGSAGGVDAPDLLAARMEAARLAWTVVAITQPFRLAGRRNPGPTPAQDQAWIETVAMLRVRFFGPLVQAGRSNGARVVCRTAAATGAAAAVCLAFPLHPPGRPDRDRRAELAAAGVPVVVVQGDRDPFGMPPRGRGRRTVVVPGADHSLRGAEPVITREVRRLLRAASR